MRVEREQKAAVLLWFFRLCPSKPRERKPGVDAIVLENVRMSLSPHFLNDPSIIPWAIHLAPSLLSSYAPPPTDPFLCLASNFPTSSLISSSTLLSVRSSHLPQTKPVMRAVQPPKPTAPAAKTKRGE
jgi:hypothetical protein